MLSVVQKFASRGENLDDLFQVGCIGLIKAIDNFDPSQKVRFSTYGVPMICGEVKRYLRDNNAVRVSRSIRDLAYHSMRRGRTADAGWPRTENIGNRRPGRVLAGECRHGAGIRRGTHQLVRAGLFRR